LNYETETNDGENYTQNSKLQDVNHSHSTHSNEEDTLILSEKVLKWGIIRYNWRVLTLSTSGLNYENSGQVTSVHLDKFTQIYPNSNHDGFIIQNDYTNPKYI